MTIGPGVFIEWIAHRVTDPVQAGYIFAERSLKLGREWRKILRWKNYPYYGRLRTAMAIGKFD